MRYARWTVWILGLVGFTASFTVDAAQKSGQPPPTGPGFQAPAPVYQMNGVPQALNLTNQQATQLGTLTTKTQQTFQPEFAKIATLPQDQQFANHNEVYSRYHTAWMNGAQSILNKQQYDRYQQLQYQYNPYQAFAIPGVQKQLNLSPQQQANLAANWQWNNQQMAAIQQQAVRDPEAGATAYATFLKERTGRINTYLTPEQQAVWQRMVGDPYTFSVPTTLPK